MTPMPHDPAPSPWAFPDLAALERAGRLPADDLLATGADLEPATLLAAYRAGLFPMPDGPAGVGSSAGGRPWSAGCCRWTGCG